MVVISCPSFPDHSSRVPVKFLLSRSMPDQVSAGRSKPILVPAVLPHAPHLPWQSLDTDNPATSYNLIGLRSFEVLSSFFCIILSFTLIAYLYADSLR
jgi:hypothetical protein